jgi:uncharacterized protein YaaN involved in tellurite resistance
VHRSAGIGSLENTRLYLFPDKPSQRHHDYLTHTYLPFQMATKRRLIQYDSAEMISNHTPNHAAAAQDTKTR